MDDKGAGVCPCGRWTGSRGVSVWTVSASKCMIREQGCVHVDGGQVNMDDKGAGVCPCGR
eukprot:1196085-Prorocentrum_minimum.AAC.2